jgi:hypothetical protein
MARTHEFHFDDLDDVINVVEHAQPRTVARRSSVREEANRYGWFRSTSMQDAIDLYREGWADGRDRVLALADNFKFLHGKPPPKWDFTRQPTGAVVDIGAHNAGEPNDMVTWQPPERKHIRITINLAVWSRVTPGAFYLRGGMAAALVDALQRHGHDVEVIVAAYSRHYCNLREETCERCGEAGYPGEQQNSLITWAAKKRHEPLDIAGLAFSIAHPSAFRRFVFRLRECLLPEIVEGVHMLDVSPHDYGKSIDLPHGNPWHGDIYFGPLANQVDWGDMMAVTDWFLDTLKAQDIEFLRGWNA